MNKTWTNRGGYRASEGRRHLLEDVLPLLPADLRAVIRPRKITEITEGKTLVYEDPLWLPSETDVFGRGHESLQNGVADGPDDFQLPIFLTERDRVKQREGFGTTPWGPSGPSMRALRTFSALSPPTATRAAATRTLPGPWPPALTSNLKIHNYPAAQAAGRRQPWT